ncbi:SDR family NAD(P)-dependent oxidoreductase [Pollutimonas bauzanensis]|uniref:3-oxoacyl-[acyl-carrier protein] reductase n=1 Tax=Pollutimonas bauzanensis TaxID=658167 RepID=A0A1M5QVX0_9BURK|nr:SDR family NAD(P)-dependent oxidoreductase [Pollutimonas bauzanensis]SHH18327.1 3-oxoacyl-[acyl-carrier protein] reductase [Pollutimonas bauzanensis]
MYSTELLSGRVALVTGGAGGIGRAVSEALAGCGAQVAAADISVADAPAAGGAAPAPIERVALDVTRRADVLRCVDDIIQRFGRLDILVNVAGVVSMGSAEHLAEQEWDRVMAINLKGTFLCCQAAMPHMRRQGFGRIVNLGSVIGKNGGNPRPWLDPREQERASNVAYGVSKAGVHIMTAFLAKELASSGVTVNAVAPGPVASAMTSNFPQSLRDLIPAGRMGSAEEVAAAVLFLAAPQSSFITGETLDVNGGIWCD